jgi:hypothetical protein
VRRRKHRRDARIDGSSQQSEPQGRPSGTAPAGTAPGSEDTADSEPEQTDETKAGAEDAPLQEEKMRR